MTSGDRVVVTADPDRFFVGADVVLLLDDVPPVGEGERRADWLRRVGDRVSVYGRRIDAACSPDAVVVVPATNSAANVVGAAVARSARRLSPRNVLVVPRLVEDRAAEAVSLRAGASASESGSASCVAGLIVWGDASAASPGRFALDASRATVCDVDATAVWAPERRRRPVDSVVLVRRWLHRDLPAILSSSSSSSSSSVVAMATALTSFLSDWWASSCDSQRLHSVAVASQGHSHQQFHLVNNSIARTRM